VTEQDRTTKLWRLAALEQLIYNDETESERGYAVSRMYRDLNAFQADGFARRRIAMQNEYKELFKELYP